MHPSVLLYWSPEVWGWIGWRGNFDSVGHFIIPKIKPVEENENEEQIISSVLEEKEEEHAHAGRTTIDNSSLAHATFCSGAVQEETKKHKDTLLADTRPLSEVENSGIEQVQDSDEDADKEETSQT